MNTSLCVHPLIVITKVFYCLATSIPETRNWYKNGFMHCKICFKISLDHFSKLGSRPICRHNLKRKIYQFQIVVESKACLAGPRLSQMLAVPSHLLCKRSRYSNRTVKYSIKAVSNCVYYIQSLLHCDNIIDTIE